MTCSDDDMIRRGDAIELARKQCLLSVDDLRALPAVQVAVKPLEWLEHEGHSGFEVWTALGILGRYKAQRNCEKGYAILVLPNGTIAQYPSIEAAKAAAQADYEARIRSALTVQPSPDVAALVEAADKLLGAYSAIVGAGNPWGDELRAALAAWTAIAPKPATDALTPWGIQPDGSGLDPATLPIHLGGKAGDNA